MLRKNVLLTLISLSAFFITSCVEGEPVLNKPPVTAANSLKPGTNSGNTATTGTKFAEPLTDIINPDPKAQFNSYQKILRALKIGDFEYVKQEFDKGGLKTAALKADTEFGEYPISSSARVILQNVGLLGLQNKDITTFNTVDKKEILDKLIKQVFIYSVRGWTNRLIENNKSGLAKDDKYSVEVANNIFIYFYGNEGGSPAINSIAQLSQAVDKNNSLAPKSFDQISTGLNQVKASAKENMNGLISGKNLVEKGLYKMLYMATLEKVAQAEKTINVNLISDAEYYFIGIQKPATASGINNNSFLNLMLTNRKNDPLNYKIFEKGLNQGFYERAREEVINAISKIDSDNLTAQNNALSAKLFIDIPNSTFKNLMVSHVANSELTRNADDFRTAIQNKNKSSANSIRDKIFSIISITLK